MSGVGGNFRGGFGAQDDIANDGGYARALLVRDQIVIDGGYEVEDKGEDGLTERSIV